MDLTAGESIKVDNIGVRLEGGVRRASVSRGSTELPMRGTRGDDDVSDLLEASGFRVSGAVDISVDPLTPGLGRGDAESSAPARIVLEAPALAAGERSQVALVDDGGTLRWLFPSDDPRHFVLDVDDEASTERGVLGTAIRKGIKFLTVKALKPLAGAAVESLAAAAESRIRPSRLRTFEPDTFRSDDVAAPDVAELVGQPALLFIHGTNSSTTSGFGQLPTDWVRALNDRYGGRVFAFDHPTLSVMPGDNADRLAELVAEHLPEGAELTLDVVAHSRGGLVARELAERPRTGVHVRSVTFVATPNNGTPIASAAHLGSFVDVLTNLAAVVPDNPVTDAIQVVFELVKDIALDIAFDSLPGIKAMTPDGVYLTALNAEPRRADLVYRAVAANFEPLNTSGNLAQLRNRVSDKVFTGSMNDLVVPTRSAYLRSGGFFVDPRQRIVLDSTRSVSHSTFWTETDVLARLDSWLDGAEPDEWPPPTPTGDPATSDPQADLESAMEVADSDGVAAAIDAVSELPSKFSDAIDQIAGGPVRHPGGPAKPAGDVVILPGIMGSLLETDEGLVWIDPWKLMRGRFSTLSLDRPTQAGRAAGLNMAYAALAAKLSATWRVHLFPFDWRQDIRTSADRLNEFIRTVVMADGKRPVHLVAHSMGGLVARSFIQRHGETWDEMDADKHRNGGRLIMLGTPNQGSYAIPLALAGDDMLVKGLAAVDLRNSKADIARVVATFPGMYQMLPAPSLDVDDDHVRLFDATAWSNATVDEALLHDARSFHGELDAGHDVDKDAPRMVYVAGDQQRTPGRIVIDGDQHHFGVTDEGDGRVLHRSGALEGVQTYYALTGHGALASDAVVLDTLDDLLKHGTTEHLSTSRYPRRGGADEPTTATIPAGEVDRDPLTPAARGAGGALRRDDVAATMADSLSSYVVHPAGTGVTTAHEGLRVSVTHASLEQSRHPVIVGHYRGIPPEGAEGFLDWRLGGALSRRFVADEYPDEPGEAIYVAGTSQRPSGGLVVGLGDFGELTRSKLVKSIRTAVARRALAANEAGETGPIGVSSVLVGSPGDYDLTLGVAMSAIVEGFARAAIDIEKLDGMSCRLTELEIVELYEARAIRAAQQLGQIVGALPVEIARAVPISADAELRNGRGRRPGLPTRENSGAWPRFVIERRLPPCPPRDDHDDDKPYPCGDQVEAPAQTLPTLEFTQLGRGAQVDRLTVAFDDDKINRLIASAIGNPRAVDESFALFEMLFPHAQKLELDDADNLHLLVDEDSAFVPWELLYGRGDGRSGTALALRTGMLRQLRPGRGGETVRRTGRRPEGRRALVIGDPPADGYSRLPGARQEAKEVRDLLTRNGYDVTALIFDDDDDPDSAWLRVQSALYRHPYQIIHFATHGEVDDERPERSGLLIGGTMRLTALDIRQMSATPDLVFVNACHTARTGTGLAAARSTTRVDQIASNFALQLMRNGVRAVIAAGWAVDDAAALSFANATYSALLGGDHYGNAVLAGRRAADDRGRSNTWGAYQCYGDPSFSLVRPSGWHDASSTVSEGQLVEELTVLKQQASDAGDLGRRQRVHDWVASTATAEVPRFATTRVLEALAEVYGELGCYADATWAYREAERVDRPSGQMTLRAHEQLANMEVRLAAESRRRDRPQLPRHHEIADTPGVLFDGAAARLKDLLSFAETQERHNLTGSLYKKRAAAMGPRTRAASAATSRDGYRAAALIAIDHESTLAAYPLCAWIQLSRIASPRGRQELQGLMLQLLEFGAQTTARAITDHPTLLPQLRDAMASDDDRVPRMLREAAQAYTAAPLAEKPADVAPAGDFWEDAENGDIALTRMVYDAGRSDTPVTADIAVSHYLAAFNNRSSVRERDSVLDHVVDLLDIVTARHPARPHLQTLRDELTAAIALIEATGS